MKKIMILLTLILMVVLSGCTGSLQSEIPDVKPSNDIAAEDGQTKAPADEAPSGEWGSETTEQSKSDVFFDICSLYQQAIKEKWDGNKLTKNSMSLIMLDCYGASPFDNIGYTYADLDENGKKELVIALTDAFTDDYYGKLVLDVYSVDEKGDAVQVFSSGYRNRYYYAGNNLFANIGSGGASIDINTTLKLQGVEMIDTATVTKPTAYQQLKLSLFSESTHSRGLIN